jgi:type VI secretion system protein VasI
MRSTLLAVTIAGVLLIFQSARPAESPSSLGACAAVQGDLARLQCYDDLARKTGVSPKEEPAAGSDWKLYTETNPVDDSKTVILSVVAKNARSKFGQPFTLNLRCMSHKTAAYINWNEFLGEDETKITSRFGQNQATTQSWPLSGNKQASFVPGDSVQFIKRLAHANQFIAQVTPYNESPTTAIFNTSGLTDAITPLAATCGWKF